MDFKKYFAQFGKVVSAEVMFNRETNKSRGFGFVIFESETSVELVLQEPNHVLDGKSVRLADEDAWCSRHVHSHSDRVTCCCCRLR